MKNLHLFAPLPQLREFSLLEELGKNPFVSQRDLAIRTGIALGATNTCLRRMAERRWIQVRNINGRQREYYLTEGGIWEKERLVSKMVSRAIEHYVWIKGLMRGKLLEIQNAGIKRIVFYGVSDEMEIAYMTSQQLNLELVGIIEDGGGVSPKEIFGFKLTPVENINTLEPEGILLTSFSRIEERMNQLEKYIETSSLKIVSL